MTKISSIKNLLKKGSAGSVEMIGKTKNKISYQSTDFIPGLLPYPRKFEMVSAFVTEIKDVLAISDRYHYGEPYLWYHSTKHLMRYAFNDYPVPGIIYSKVLVCRGNLWNTQNAYAKASVVSDAVISFSWKSDIGVNGASLDDKCILVAYCESLNKCVFINDGGERRLEKAILTVPDFRFQKVHTWLGFISADGARISNSIYTGEVIVT